MIRSMEELLWPKARRGIERRRRIRGLAFIITGLSPFKNGIFHFPFCEAERRAYRTLDMSTFEVGSGRRESSRRGLKPLWRGKARTDEGGRGAKPE